MASACVLRASGDEFQTAEFLRESSFEPVNVFQKGERKAASRTWNTSGITVNVSEADAFEEQVGDAIAFIETNYAELQRLKETVGVEGFELDFGVNGKDSFIQSYVFTSELTRLAGEISLALEISIYAGGIAA
ncbi:MAG: hypothetical protein ABI878_15330 [Acidobacteriota bacterium]